MSALAARSSARARPAERRCTAIGASGRLIGRPCVAEESKSHLKALAAAAVFTSAAGAAAAEFRVSFAWGGIPLCTTGREHVVGSPHFVPAGVPGGTEPIAFRLKDLDAPNCNHGGATGRVGRDGAIPFGTLPARAPAHRLACIPTNGASRRARAGRCCQRRARDGAIRNRRNRTARRARQGAPGAPPRPHGTISRVP